MSVVRQKSKRSKAMIARLSSIKRMTGAVSLALVLALLGCTGVIHSDAANNNSSNPPSANANADAGEPEMKDQQAGGPLDPRLAAANVKFGLKLYSQLLTESAEKNIFVSPPSVALSLTMAYNGAGGATRAAMARALETQGLSLEELNRAYAAFRAALENPDAKVK